MPRASNWQGFFDSGFPRMAGWRSHMGAREPSLAQDDILTSVKCNVKSRKSKARSLDFTYAFTSGGV